MKNVECNKINIIVVIVLPPKFYVKYNYSDHTQKIFIVVSTLSHLLDLDLRC